MANVYLLVINVACYCECNTIKMKKQTNKIDVSAME